MRSRAYRVVGTLAAWAFIAAAGISSGAAEPISRPTPWTQGVSSSQQSRARALWQEGNELLSRDPAQAEARYRQALAHWKHPKIHYNLALALVDQGKDPVEALEQIEKALRYGKAPFDEAIHRHALRNKRLLERQIAGITLTCDEAGAEVALNGEPVFTGPGRAELRVRPGRYHITATKADFVAENRTLVLLPGESEHVVLQPVSMQHVATVQVRCDEPEATVSLNGKPLLRCPGEESTIVAPGEEQVFLIGGLGRVTTRTVVTLAPGEKRTVSLQTASPAQFTTRMRFPRATVRGLVAGGATVTALGALLYWRARDGFDDYDALLETTCGGDGCSEDEVPSRKLYRRAVWSQRAAVGATIIGVGTVITGLALGAFNKPMLVRISENPTAGWSLAPVVMPGDAGVTATLRF